MLISGNFLSKTSRHLHSQMPGVFMEHQQSLGWKKGRGVRENIREKSGVMGLEHVRIYVALAEL